MYIRQVYLLRLVMEQKEKPIDNLKGTIIACLYYTADSEPVQGELIQVLASGYPAGYAGIAVKQLIGEHLVKEENGRISLTSRGCEVIHIYGNYREYLHALEKRRINKEKEKQLDSKVKKSTILSNYLNATSAICSIIGFIAGVLSADQIKRILTWLLSTA